MPQNRAISQPIPVHPNSQLYILTSNILYLSRPETRARYAGANIIPITMAIAAAYLIINKTLMP